MKTLVLMLALAAARDGGTATSKKKPAAPATKTAPVEAPKPKPPEKPSEPTADVWDFDGLTVKANAHGEPVDPLSIQAMQTLGGTLDGAVELNASAHPNTVGGVTLRLEDPHDARQACDLYTTREGDALRFTDGRCSFTAFDGSLRTTITCRKIAGTATRTKDGVAVTASTPDCTGQPMGLPMTVRGTLSPR